MRHDEIEDDLRPLIFDFFFWFSRFESALKENGWLQFHDVGAPARPSWADFVVAHEERYVISKAGADLIAAKPRKQVVGDTGLTFAEIGFDDLATDLERVSVLLRTVRNNLFHGGKHGGADWDDPARIRTLLPLGVTLLAELADFAGLEADYTGYY